MTTLVTLATKDSLVMGCDSLGSVTQWMVDPLKLNEFFDPQQKFTLKMGEDGKPILKEFNDIYKKSELIPYYHMTHVSKLFSLEPLEMGVMTTGIASIGSRTIKSIVREFKTKESSFKAKRRPTNYTVKSIAQKLLDFIMKYYDPEFSKETYKPVLELMIGGYDKRKHVPDIYRIFVHENKTQEIFEGDAPFGIAFGGQMDEIQRIVFGTDWQNVQRLKGKVNKLLDDYRKFLQDYLKEKGITEELPKGNNLVDGLSSFRDWDFLGFDANLGDFSNQNAIECVDWFVGIMIKSHEFRSHLPMVGGNVHVGLITKDKGFNFISKEEYTYKGHGVTMEDM